MDFFQDESEGIKHTDCTSIIRILLVYTWAFIVAMDL